MDSWIMPVVGALLGFIGLLLLLVVCIVGATLARWIHDRRVIRGKLDRQLQRRLTEFVKREQVEL